jgi:hypothetical protein
MLDFSRLSFRLSLILDLKKVLLKPFLVDMNCLWLMTGDRDEFLSCGLVDAFWITVSLGCFFSSCVTSFGYSSSLLEL